MSINYLAEPFHPWWDESKTGPSPNCEICGAMMVRTTHDNIERREPGWVCRSCDNYHADQGAEKESE